MLHKIWHLNFWEQLSWLELLQGVPKLYLTVKFFFNSETWTLTFVCVLTNLKWVLKFKIILQGWPHIIFTHFQMCFEILWITHRLFDEVKKHGSEICTWHRLEKANEHWKYVRQQYLVVDWYNHNYDTINWSTEMGGSLSAPRHQAECCVLRSTEQCAHRGLNTGRGYRARTKKWAS